MLLQYAFINSSDIECKCTTKHVPKPVNIAHLTDIGVDLCPTTLMNLLDLLNEYELTGGGPDGSLTKHYSKYTRDLAKRIYEGRQTECSQ